MKFQPSDDDLRSSFAAGVYLFCPEKVPTHNSGCLIEGLLELGIPVRTNAERITSREAAMPLKGVDLAALNAPMYTGLAAYVLDISHTNRHVPISGLRDSRVAYLTTSDVSLFCKAPDDTLVFATHETAFARMGGRRVPVGFGLSAATIAAIADPPPFKSRRRAALRNFRATLSQGVRAMLDLAYVPALERRIPVDRTDYAADAYMKALRETQICLAYGGEFFAAVQTNPYLAKAQPQVAEIHTFKELHAPALIMRWDSWRFWESLAAGCLTVQLDFEKYGFQLPVKPEPWVHYVPLDLADLNGSLERMFDREQDWPEIAAAGRAWALRHYAPAPTAATMLAEILKAFG
ncbi:MAG: hypothetical protein SFV21_01160 [Rhodospirillaceae bacterium]|nr:hypothetical protein [Rhodospirillaceae bacterium]